MEIREMARLGIVILMLLTLTAGESYSTFISRTSNIEAQEKSAEPQSIDELIKRIKEGYYEGYYYAPPKLGEPRKQPTPASRDALLKDAAKVLPPGKIEDIYQPNKFSILSDIQENVGSVRHEVEMMKYDVKSVEDAVKSVKDEVESLKWELDWIRDELQYTRYAVFLIALLMVLRMLSPVIKHSKKFLGIGEERLGG